MAKVSWHEAERRLRNRWWSEVTRNPNVAPLFPLGHFLTAENIAVVRRLDLYREYSNPKPDPRQRELIRAWMNTRPGSVQ